MAILIDMAGYRRSAPVLVRIERDEMSRLLSLYAGRVASGEWRDYAIDFGPDGAVFSVFRHTREPPVLSIAKRASGEWVLSSGGRQLARSRSLAEVLDVLNRRG